MKNRKQAHINLGCIPILVYALFMSSQSTMVGPTWLMSTRSGLCKDGAQSRLRALLVLFKNNEWISQCYIQGHIQMTE